MPAESPANVPASNVQFLAAKQLGKWPRTGDGIAYGKQQRQRQCQETRRSSQENRTAGSGGEDLQQQKDRG